MDCNNILPFWINYFKFVSSEALQPLFLSPKWAQNTIFAVITVQLSSQTHGICIKRLSQSIGTQRYYFNEIISNDGDIRKPYLLFRPQIDPKIPVYISNC